ncbi:MAG: hypothetical protein H6746_14310 [Deltaproteobacteria bacterium]|nr:hypothetical protein [Deltaproteobacteria bacterium]
MRTLTLSFLVLGLVACGESSPTNKPDADAVADTDATSGDTAVDTDAVPDTDVIAGDTDADAAPDGADADATGDGDGGGEVADADVSTDGSDVADTSDGDATPDGADTADGADAADCSALANACSTANAKRCAPSGPATAQQCVLKDGCLQWLDAEICEENNLCTGKPDLCVEGACVPDGDPNANCETPTGECMANLCDAATGLCQLQTGLDFEACDDGDVCTESDICFDGTCTGESSCPKACELGDLSCNTVKNVTLNGGGGTSVMNAYGCDGADSGYDGFEQSMLLANKTGSACGDFQVAVELADPKKAGDSYADVMLLDKASGICWPADCMGAGFMDGQGRALLETNLAAGAQYVVVVDGRETFSGDVRVVANCCGGNPRELFCSNDEDDDGDGLTDCDDPDCSDDPAGGVTKICSFEHSCNDGIDNDGDLAKDCADPDCAKRPACTTEASCDDQIDDDGDGLTDCDDPSCDGTVACGGGCPDATVLTCGEPLVGQSIANNGVNTFSNQAVPACGQSTRDTTYTGKHGLYQASVPAGCTGTVVIDFDNPAIVMDTFVFGPGCLLDACQQGELFASHFELPVSALPSNWIMVADFSGSAQASATYDVELQCVCP